MLRFRALVLAAVPVAALAACAAEPEDNAPADGDVEVVTVDGKDQEQGSCFANTHSVGGRKICLVKQANGRWFVDCLNGRRAVIGDYNWALQYCDPNPPAAPPPPQPKTPGATCSSEATGSCRYKVNGQTVGICSYTCTDGTKTSRFAPCPYWAAGSTMPTCP